MRLNWLFFTAWGILASPAVATPGVGDPVYGASVDKGVTEIEMRYGRLTGGAADREDGMVFEAEHAVSSRVSIAGLIETGREPGASRQIDALAVEGIYALGRVRALNLDTALYAEFKHGLHGEPDVIEAKSLFQHRTGNFDGRLNLIAEQPLRSGEALEFGYAASADWAVLGDEVRVGMAAFGDLGTMQHFGGRQEHFAGPVTKLEIEHLGPGELEIEAGWLRAFGAARDVTDGQARLLVGFEGHF